jgi:hypothetical protein
MNRIVAFVTLAAALTACSYPTAMGSSERAGLGTTWGETRASRVHLVSFERDDSERPLAVANVTYDDPEGIRTMSREAGLFDGPGGGAALAGGALRVRLVDAWGVPLPVLARGARQYVEGREGQRYAIEIENRGPVRVEAVATVDGLDVFDGRPGALDKRGYVLEPWSTFRIDGFRQNLGEVAAFRFGAVSESYAAQKGDDRNVGVIGVAFFGERGAPPASWLGPDPETARRLGADPFPGRFAEPPADRW